MDGGEKRWREWSCKRWINGGARGGWREVREVDGRTGSPGVSILRLGEIEKLI